MLQLILCRHLAVSQSDDGPVLLSPALLEVSADIWVFRWVSQITLSAEALPRHGASKELCRRQKPGTHFSSQLNWGLGHLNGVDLDRTCEAG